MKNKSFRIGKHIFAFYFYKLPESKNDNWAKNERKQQETK